jgi:NDP-sugar pyrophosphorylase family protein
MQIIIPMSGFGERFRAAGYNMPKPLIKVEGKTIIQHIVEMFPGETDFTFICNSEHLNHERFSMRETLNIIAPKGRIVSISPHKLGPIHAVLQALDYLDFSKPTIVNYADFTCDWSYADFCKYVKSTNCDGAIPCYRGFHPHTLWSNYYAYVPEKNFRALDIQEKKPFTDSPREEFASSGTYYFKSATIMKRYFELCVSNDLKVGGEYYVSMAYKSMIKDGLDVQVYELNHFMQWGTPADFEEYLYWSDTFKAILREKDVPSHKGALMLPMAGLGSRFQESGYDIPKPLIPVSGKYMAVQALMDLPQTDQQKFILRKDLIKLNQIKESLEASASRPIFTLLSSMTDGQASTCIEGIDGLDSNEPLTIAACDNGMIYDAEKFNSLMKSDKIDVIVWVARGYPGAIRSPKMYGWVDANNSGEIKNISVKKALKDPRNDPIVVGAFTFKKLDYFVKSVEKMKERGAKINNEYYVDTAINDSVSLGLRCVVFEIEYYICWGAPHDLKTFEYWQSCFNNWKSHPYEIEKDKNFAK